MAKNKMLLWILSISIQFSFAKNYFIVYFKDKSHNTYSLNTPQNFLSAKALERRSKEDITLNTSDLPVSRLYVDSLLSKNINVLYTSKWLNAALVYDDETKLQGLNYQIFDSYALLGRREEVFKYTENTSSNTSSKVHDFYGQSFTQIDMMNVDSLHTEGYTGSDVLIAVFDEGFLKADSLMAFKHIFQQGKVIDTYSFVDQSNHVYDKGRHGTQVLSCLAAKLEGKLIGPSYNSTFALYRTEDSSQENPVEEFYYLLAAERADSLGVDIVSTSIGYRDFDNSSFDHQYSDLNGKTTVASFAARMLARKGIILVTSAGNTGAGTFKFVGTPADSDSILTVGAVNDSYVKASFSSIGPTSDGRIKPDVVALGQSTVCVDMGIDGNVVTSNGTSFSTPLVAGFVALIKERFPSLKTQQLIQYIKSISSNHVKANNQIGHGVPYYGNRGNIVDSVIDEDLDMYYNNEYLHLDINRLLINNEIRLNIYDGSGRMCYNETIEAGQNKREKLPLGHLSIGRYICIAYANGKIYRCYFTKSK